jgi:hypothetical protein
MLRQAQHERKLLYHASNRTPAKQESRKLRAFEAARDDWLTTRDFFVTTPAPDQTTQAKHTAGGSTNQKPDFASSEARLLDDIETETGQFSIYTLTTTTPFGSR